MERLFLPKWLTNKGVQKFGSHAKAARAIGVPVRTYADWRLRGFKFDKAHERAWSIVHDGIVNGSTGTKPSGEGDA
jgi:hypothetical protein